MLQLDGKLGANDVCTFIYCLRVSKVFPFAPEIGDITLALDKFHKSPIMLEFNTEGKAHASFNVKWSYLTYLIRTFEFQNIPAISEVCTESSRLFREEMIKTKDKSKRREEAKRGKGKVEKVRQTRDASNSSRGPAWERGLEQQPRSLAVSRVRKGDAIREDSLHLLR